MSPMKHDRYPKDWKQISASIRERAGHKCEECGVANYAVGARDCHGVWHDADSIDSMNSDAGWALWPDGYPKIIKIVLTVAHLDHNPANNDPSNLRAWCQRCHLRYDVQHHAANAKVAHARKREQRLADAGNVRLL